MDVRCFSGLFKRCVATSGVLHRIVRNFGILKIVLLIPTRLEQYSIGPFDVSFTHKAISNIGTERIMMEMIAKNKSTTRFIILEILAHQK